MRCAPLLFVALTACIAAEDPTGESVQQISHQPNGGQAPSKGKTNNLIDHGGTVLPASKTVAIYWGDVSQLGDLQPAMDSLLGGLNGSHYVSLANEYMRGPSATTAFGGDLFDPSTPPKTAPSTNALGNEVCKLVGTPDPSTLYIVFTSNTPNISYCAWHDKTSCNGVTFEIAYVPNQGGLPGCSPTYNGVNLGCNSYSDATLAAADSVAHEFMETITDAHIDAWYDGKGYEIADKCEYVYSHCEALGSGGTKSSWQIQQEWSNAAGGCVE